MSRQRPCLRGLAAAATAMLAAALVAGLPYGGSLGFTLGCLQAALRGRPGIERTARAGMQPTAHVAEPPASAKVSPPKPSPLEPSKAAAAHAPALALAGQDEGWDSAVGALSHEAESVSAGNEGAPAGAQKAALESIASTPDAAEEESGAPAWLPVAALGAGVLFASILLTGSVVPPAKVQAAIPASEPMIVEMTTLAPAPPAPASEPLIVELTRPAPARAAEIAPSPKPPPPPPAASASAPADDGGVAKQIAGLAAFGLRKTADILPAASSVVDREAPNVASGLQWAAGVAAGPEDLQTKAEEALPVVGSAVESAARAGLQGGALGLKITADNLPQAGAALSGAIESATPGVQALARGGAGAARELAEQLAKPEALPSQLPEEVRGAVGSAAPLLLQGTAAGLDVFAAVAPAAGKVLEFGTSKAIPIFQAALNVGADVTTEVSKADIDKAKLAEGAQGLAKGAAELANTAKAQAEVLGVLKPTASALPLPGAGAAQAAAGQAAAIAQAASPMLP